MTLGCILEMHGGRDHISNLLPVSAQEGMRPEGRMLSVGVRGSGRCEVWQ